MHLQSSQSLSRRLFWGFNHAKGYYASETYKDFSQSPTFLGSSGSLFGRVRLSTQKSSPTVDDPVTGSGKHTTTLILHKENTNLL